MEDTVQMRALVRCESLDGGLEPKKIFWCSRAHAEHYIQNRIAELIAPPAGPKETPTVEPTELKKSLPVESAGLSTDSQPSGASGREPQQSASRVDPASTTTTSRRSLLSLPKRK